MSETCPYCSWIPVENGYPEMEYKDIGDEVLVYLDYPYYRVAAMKFAIDNGVPSFWTGQQYTTTDWTKSVTHWRLLPAPPEAKE